jgi:hypothetical protein
MEVNDGYGLVFHVRGKSPEVHAAAENPDGKIDWFRPPSRSIRSKDPRHTITYGFGPTFLSKQEIRSSGSTGTSFWKRHKDRLSAARSMTQRFCHSRT